MRNELEIDVLFICAFPKEESFIIPSAKSVTWRSGPIFWKGEKKSV